MAEKKITYLDPVPVRYNYSTPSMSRRGGTRLHPVRDGVINPLRHQQSLRTTDYTGQPLRDITNHLTGMYSHSVSAAESAPLNPAGSSTFKSGVSGTPDAAMKRLAAQVVETDTGRVYLDDEGRVIRTTDMGEARVIARPKNAGGNGSAHTEQREVSVSARAPKRATRNAPGGTGPFGRISTADVEAFIRAMAAKRGVELTVITPQQLALGREALKSARVAAAKELAKRASK